MKRITVDVIVDVADDVDASVVKEDVEDLTQKLLSIEEYNDVDVWCEDEQTTVDEKIALSLARVTEIDKSMVNSIVAGAKVND